MINYSLTIVIVTFNSSEIIKQSLENIDCNKYLLIIVDNASTDNTVAVIESILTRKSSGSNLLNDMVYLLVCFKDSYWYLQSCT